LKNTKRSSKRVLTCVDKSRYISGHKVCKYVT
jgi:hypothetical protein